MTGNRSTQERAFFLEALRSPAGGSLWVPLWFSLIIFSTAFLFASNDYNGVNGHLMDLSCLISSTAVFMVARFLPKVNQAWSNLVTWVLAGMASALGAAAFVFLLSGSLNSELLGQLPVGLVAYSLLVAICGITVSGVRISRTRLRKLRRDQAELLDAKDSLEQQIATMRGEIGNQVVDELHKASDLLRSSDPKVVSSKLYEAIDSVIRPLSHRLAGLGAVSSVPPTKLDDTVSVETKRGVAISRLVAPELYALLFVVFILPSAFFLLGLPGLFITIGLLFIDLGLWAVLVRVGSTLYVSRIVGMLMLAISSTAIGSLLLLVLPARDSIGITVGFTTVSLTVTGLMALVSRRLDILQRMAFINREMQAVVAILRQEAWAIKTQLAKAIHGQVQAKFLSVALRLGASPKPSKRDLDLAMIDIQESMASVASAFASSPDSLMDQLQTIVEVWDGVSELSLEIDDAVLKTIDDFPVSRTCLVEVIGEAVSNASKHSKAPKVQVSVKLSSANQLKLVVRSAGNLTSHEVSRSGYGSHVLNEVTSAWSLREHAGSIRLSATIQLAK